MLQLLAAPCEMHVHGDATAHAFGDDAEVLVARLAPLEAARIRAGKAGRQIDVDAVDAETSFGIACEMRGHVSVDRIRLQMRLIEAECQARR